MSRMAKVGSIQDLMDFRASLAKFIQAASATLDESLGEIRRIENWLKNEQPAYWKKKEMFLTDKVTQIRQDLSRKQQLDSVGPVQSRKSYVDEKQALEKARRLLEETQEKLKNTKRWSVIVEREASIYRGMTNDLRDMLEVKLPNARAQLDNMVMALEAYAAVAEEEDQTGPAMVFDEELESDQPDDQSEKEPKPKEKS